MSKYKITIIIIVVVVLGIAAYYFARGSSALSGYFSIAPGKIVFSEVTPTSFTSSATANQETMRFSVQNNVGKAITLGGILFNLSTDAILNGNGDLSIRKGSKTGTTVGLLHNWTDAGDKDASGYAPSTGIISGITDPTGEYEIGDVLGTDYGTNSGFIDPIVVTAISDSADTITVRNLYTGLPPLNIDTTESADWDDTRFIFLGFTTVFVPFESAANGKIASGATQTYSLSGDTTGALDDEIVNLSINRSEDVFFLNPSTGKLDRTRNLTTFPVQSDWEK